MVFLIWVKNTTIQEKKSFFFDYKSSNFDILRDLRIKMSDQRVSCKINAERMLFLIRIEFAQNVLKQKYLIHFLRKEIQKKFLFFEKKSPKSVAD